MNCIVIATGHCPGVAPLDERYPAPMLPLVDRPFLQHVVECLVDYGITDFDFILGHLPEKVEEFLGEGTRWGSRFRFHLARDPIRPYGFLPIVTAQDEWFFLVHADRLPQLSVPAGNDSEGAVLFYHQAEGRRRWSGWARLMTSRLGKVTDMDESALESHLGAAAGVRSVEVPEMLSVQSFDDVLASNQKLVAKQFSGLAISGREAGDGIWLSRNVSLHPTATLVPPVYVGQSCRVGVGVRLGPNAIVGHGCVLDTRCTVADSVVFPGSYVGEALELDHVLVDKNRVVNVKVGAAVSIADDFILSGVAGGRLARTVGRWLSQLGAVALLAVSWPVLVLTALCLAAFRFGPVLRKKEVVRLPAPADPLQWKSFELWSFATEPSGGGWPSHVLLRVLPALLNVARGELCFVGAASRSKDEIASLPHDWQALYLGAKAGIVTEAFVQYGWNPTEDEVYSAEVFYSVNAGLRHDVKLLLRYIARLLLLPPAGHEQPSD